MAVLLLLLEASGLLGFTWLLLGRYRDAHVSSAGLAAVFISWTLGFTGLLLLPIDIARHSQSLLQDSENEDNVEGDRADVPGFLLAWQVLYWSTFVLSWFVLPFLVEYSLHGEFRVERRIIGSFRRLVLHWTVLVAVIAGIVVYLVFFGHFTMHGLVGLAMAGANTYGLLWLILLLGYGLVDIPRSLWTLRYPEVRLRSINFRANQVHHERMEAIFLYQDVLLEVRGHYDRMLSAESASIILTSDMQEVKAGMNAIMDLVEADRQDGDHYLPSKMLSSRIQPSKTRTTASPMLSTSTMSYAAPSYNDVVELHRRVKSAQADLRGTEQAWLEMCLLSEKLHSQEPTTNIAAPPVGLYSTTNLGSQIRLLACSSLEELRRLLVPQLWALCACLTAVSSICILWGELTMAWTAEFSLFHVLSLAGRIPPSSTEIIAFLLLVYMVLCAYSSLFKLRSFGRFALRGHRNSSELALLKTSMHQCRLQFALGCNFLLLVHEPELTNETAFHQLWSHMQVVRIFGRDFSMYAPVLIIILVVCTMANVYARVVKQIIGMEQYEQLLPGNAEHESQIIKGEQLLRKGRERLRRRDSRKPSSKEVQWRGRGMAASHDMAISLLASQDMEEEVDSVP